MSEPSLKLRLIRFFAEPGEELVTSEDVAIKYSVDISTAYKVLRDMVREGRIEETRVPSQRIVREVVAFKTKGVA